MKMKIDIWSDVVCPFCYMGKKRLETALNDFPYKSEVELVWHSFLLDPGMTAQPGVDLYDYLAERKGQTRDWAKKIHDKLENNAKADGIEFNFGKAIIANSFDAHRLIQMAKANGLGDAIEEELFKVYFTYGKNIADHTVLTEVGVAIGLKETEVKAMLNHKTYTADVVTDVQQAQSMGISGVPFFVVNNRYGISGAQPASLFAETIGTAWKEFEKTHSLISVGDANNAVCKDDSCDIPSN